MQDLPQELVDRICGYLRREHLKKVLLLSRKFCYSAERFSGFFEEYTINESNEQQFITRFSGHRLLYLREVIFPPTFPPFVGYNEEAEEASCRETADEVCKRDELFTYQIQWLFRALSSMEDQPREKRVQGRYRLSIYSPTRLTADSDDWLCPHHVVIGWRVRLLKVELPLISSVHSFEIYNNYNNTRAPHYFYRGMASYDPSEFKLDLSILIDLATRFPNLEFLGVRTGGFEWCEYAGEDEEHKFKAYESDWPGLQRDARNRFSDAVLSLDNQLPKFLRRAYMDFLSPLNRAINIKQDRPLPDLVGPLKHDRFSSSLRLLGNNLRHLQLRGMIDESIFLQEDNNAPVWPNLEQLEIMFHIARPDGTWYFEGFDGRGHDSVGFPVTDAHYPPYETTRDEVYFDRHNESWPQLPPFGDEDSDEESWPQTSNVGEDMHFRVVPNDKLRPLLEGFAKATMQMRYLKEAIIWCPLLCDDESSWDYHGSDDGAWGIRFAESGHPNSPDACRRLEWWTLSWKPDAELHSLYQQIGRSRLGDELEELWTDDLVKNSTIPLAIFADRFVDDDPGMIAPL